MHVLRETLQSLHASPVFAFYVLVTVGVAGYIGLMVGQMALGSTSSSLGYSAR